LNLISTTSILIIVHILHSLRLQIVLLGDLNEFDGVQPIEKLSQYLIQLQVADPTERYSYQFDQNSQQIDHIFTTKALAKRAQVEVLHVNTWTTAADQASDHDPVLASIRVC
jgi:predicted extracellular nuclease